MKYKRLTAGKLQTFHRSIAGKPSARRGKGAENCIVVRLLQQIRDRNVLGTLQYVSSKRVVCNDAAQLYPSVDKRRSDCLLVCRKRARIVDIVFHNAVKYVFCRFAVGFILLYAAQLVNSPYDEQALPSVVGKLVIFRAVRRVKYIISAFLCSDILHDFQREI